jgi:PTS system mannose-specific IIA component
LTGIKVFRVARRGRANEEVCVIGIVVTAHAELAHALVNTAKLVVGEGVNVTSVPINADDTSETFGPRLREAIAKVDTGDGVMVLTDMFGGTPSNVGMTMHQPGRVEVLTGVNLPMMVKAMQLAMRGADLVAMAKQVKAAGQRSIAVATEVLLGSLPSSGEIKQNSVSELDG